MKYLSVCSGIEAATVAWHSLGWTPLAFSEIEPFPRAVLQHHYPDVPLHGDFTVLRDQPWIVDADILVGGTPCQAFSVAGLRNSLSDERGNLSLEFVRLADAIDNVRIGSGRKPAIIVWENVPGVLSVKDNAFGCFLSALAGDDTPYVPPREKWTNAGVVAGPKRTIAWRVLDAQYFGLAQRRRRVFVVASAGDGFDPAAVLLEWEGLRRDTPPRRETWKDAPGHATSRAGERSHWDGDYPHPTLNQSAKASGGVGASNQELFSQRGAYLAPAPIWRAGDQANAETLVDQAGTLNCNVGQRGGLLFMQSTDVVGSLACNTGPNGHDAGDSAFTLQAGHSHAVAVQASQSGVRFNETVGTLDANYGSRRHNGVMVPVGGGDKPHVLAAVGFYANEGTHGSGQNVEMSPTLKAHPKTSNLAAVATNMAVRRLTPVECERLQGFPDGYTNIPWKKKPASDCPDGPRYKALGNSMATPCIRWIGERIQNAV